MKNKEIQDKIFKILCEHTGVVPYTIETTDDLTTIMDSVDIVAFAMDIDKEFKLNNVSIEDVKPLTINTIVRTVAEKQKIPVVAGKNVSVNNRQCVADKKCDIELGKCPMIRYAITNGYHYKTDVDQTGIQRIVFNLGEKHADRIHALSKTLQQIHANCKNKGSR